MRFPSYLLYSLQLLDCMKISLIQTKQHLNTKITGQLVSNNNFAKVAIMYKVISSLYLIQQSIAPNADDIIVL